MKLKALELVCPNCSSRNVAYSCEPKCCFNHVCTNCYFQFWPVTRLTGRRIENAERPPGEKDCSLPTAKCARCHSINVCSIEEDPDAFACAGCGSLLALEYLEDAPD